MTKTNIITPFLWFNDQAEAAAECYVSVFGNSKINHLSRNGETVLVADFTLHGQRFNALNGGPMYKFNPSISCYVVCETEAEIDSVWQQLAEGGMVMMPLNQYPWSPKYGWLQDRFGLSWQLTLGKIEDTGQKFTPSLLFTGEQRGSGEAALRFYTDLFRESSINRMSHYKAGSPGPEGSLEFGQFKLEGQTFIAMDNPMMEQQFTFNEAFSFVVHCDTQEEVDFFWEKLIEGGGSEGRCGWLKDKFGVSWQIIPEALPKALGNPDQAKSQYAMSAMMKMNKILISLLTQEGS